METTELAASHGTAPVAPSSGAKPFASICRCGNVLPVPRATGRKRLTCSAICRRQRDYLMRKLRRRQEAIAAWRAEEGRGTYSRAQVRRELAELRSEVRALDDELNGRRNDNKAEEPSL